jgi:hypothetical protein
MKRLVITRLAGTGPLPGGDGAFLALETSEGPLEVRLGAEQAGQLVAALQAAQAGLPKKEKPVASWETAIDPVNQDAVIRARYPDRTTQETRIPGPQVAAIAQFLQEASRRFESGAEMRQ